MQARMNKSSDEINVLFLNVHTYLFATQKLNKQNLILNNSMQINELNNFYQQKFMYKIITQKKSNPAIIKTDGI